MAICNCLSSKLRIAETVEFYDYKPLTNDIAEMKYCEAIPNI
ncbi:hypothetical protein SAMN04489796_105208 [Winogradskyella thalassocola]|uniref:Uncharacterized protein n=1 Tax=Winogradskyella thalassocola TaxID=262004 RepID=A0A1G8GGL8_9FLAO|nr:hypothetical protein SAMN04489796_105208 [Winogradskyella thalassocola]